MKKYIIFCCLVFMPLTCYAGSTDTFFGVYQGFSRGCQSSFIVLDKDKISIEECKKASYKIIRSESEYSVIELRRPSSKCEFKFVRIERGQTFNESIGVKLYDDAQKALSDNYSVYCVYLKVDPSTAKDQTVKFIHGKTGKARQEALHKINLQLREDRDKYNELGLKDKSPAVRETAAFFLRGKPNRFVPMIINIIANDPNSEVRASAGYSLSSFYTSNDSEGDLYIKPLERNLDKLFKGLKRVETVRSVVSILGNGYTGDSFAPCFMSATNREKIISALKEQLKSIQLLASEAFSADSRVTWDNQWNEAEHEIKAAIENITNCQSTVK